MGGYYLVFPSEMARSQVPELSVSYITVTAVTYQGAVTKATKVFKNKWAEVLEHRPDVSRTPYGEWCKLEDVSELVEQGTFTIRPEDRALRDLGRSSPSLKKALKKAGLGTQRIPAKSETL